ncbi:phytanoyl-CoA dioxygenase family protein [Actinophytocola xanthii]|uniref:Phytanoyl-CoA dioxygenase n=1 Tax=Actinophytocola xanthii TaxID=1912961 RepID=A0A1Q8CK27_9PSEU|nr:phytanoyl-CoA dioxygenase family protein [Actinophytocola xanthii]OLF14699.1 hypothetical protein BU204_25760 [Actinophytocola xanthii]
METRFLSIHDPEIPRALDRDGVVFLSDVLDPHTVEEARDRLDKYESDVLPTIPRSNYDLQDDGKLHQYRDVERFDEWFHDLVHRPTITDAVRRAVDWEPRLFYLEVFPKPPGAAGADPHQDLYTAPVEPPQFLHLWIPLVDVGPHNGGIFFYPGTHRLGIAPHIERAGKPPTVDPQVLERLASYRIQVACPAGSAALFGGDMIHYSERNTSDRSRPALVIGFRGVHTVINDEVDIVTSLVARLYREEIGLTRCRPDDDFYQLGGEDAARDRILDRLALDYGVTVAPEDHREFASPEALANLVVGRRDDRLRQTSR